MSTMRLYFHPFSPFARKIRVLIREAEYESRVEEIEINPFEQESELRDVNPLGKVPALVDGDKSIYDSVAITNYLLQYKDEFDGESFRLSSATGEILVALADGLSDVINIYRAEQLRGLDAEPDWYHQRQLRSIDQAIARCAELLPSYSDGVNVASIAVACALDYYRLRFPEADLLKRSPELEVWMNAFSARDSMLATAV